MSVDIKIPDIRIKGFNEEWLERELGAVSEIKTGPFGSSLHAEAYVEHGHAIITTEHFKSGGLPIDNKGIPQVCDEDYLRLKAYLLKTGDIVFSRVGSVDINAHVTAQQDGWLFSGRVLRVRSNDSIDSEYLHHELSTSRVRKSVVSRAVGQTMPSINTEILKITPIHYPVDKTEQTVIGNIFQKIDSLINQHQQKHDKFSNLKKSMLEKMFPKQGETIPEIRFKGFNEEWVAKELSQISDKVTEKNTSLVYSETFTNSAEFGVINQRDYFDNDISNSNNIGGYFVVHPEDFVYNPRISTFAPCGPVNRNALGRAGVMSPLYTVFRVKGVNTVFIEYFFQTKLWHTFMFLNGDTGARADRFSIKDSVFFELPLLLPLLNEQAVIGDYFQKLDTLIDQHQQQIVKLTNIKQACLSKMFV